MIKPERLLTQQEALTILQHGSHGVLSTVSAEGLPYGVPVNYCYLPQENCIFFHCAKVGRKLDNIAFNSNISFVVIGRQEVVPERFTTHYESALVTGTASIVTNEDEKISKLLLLCDKFSPGIARSQEVIRKFLPAVAICKITIGEISGKKNNDD